MYVKRTLAALLLLTASVAIAQAQGTVQFLNSALSRVLYHEDPSLPIVAAPPGTHIGVFWGTDAGGAAFVTGMGRGTLVTPTAVIGATPGIFAGPNGGYVYPIPGTSEGQRVWLKIAGWSGGNGDSLQGAVLYGESQVVSVILGPTPGPGTVVWQGQAGTATDRAKPFVITYIPEPSGIALGALGLAALLLRRRKA